MAAVHLRQVARHEWSSDLTRFTALDGQTNNSTKMKQMIPTQVYRGKNEKKVGKAFSRVRNRAKGR